MKRAWWADQVAKISFRMIVFLVLFAAPGGMTLPDNYLRAPVGPVIETGASAVTQPDTPTG